MKSLWTAVAEIAARGGRPTVSLPKALEIVEHRRPGRPRLYPPGARRGRDTGYSLTTITGRPLRCRRRGCQRTLRKDSTSICCSPTCAFLLRSECEDILDLLDGRVEARHFPPWPHHHRHDHDDDLALAPERRRASGT